MALPTGGLRWKELFGPSSGSRLVGVVWISTLVPVALRATRVEGDCHLGLCSILRRRALGAGGVRPMVDHTLGVPAGFFGFELTRAIGLMLVIAGVPGVVDSFARFALQGLGTPAPIAPTQKLVVTGLYRYVRNPIYVGVAAVIFGQALLFGDWRLLWYAVQLWLFSTSSSWCTKNQRSSRHLARSTRTFGPMSRAGFHG